MEKFYDRTITLFNHLLSEVKKQKDQHLNTRVLSQILSFAKNA